VNDLDRVFLLPHRVLDFTSARARALNTNLAHASEPGYRRVDVDFGTLAEAVRAERRGRDGATEGVRPATAIDEDALPSANGNTVQFDHEQVQVDKNALLHELAAFALNARLNTLRSAIRGQS
jgi:flagellar basal-body rod protein FlgB